MKNKEKDRKKEQIRERHHNRKKEIGYDIYCSHCMWNIFLPSICKLCICSHIFHANETKGENKKSKESIA